MNPEQAEAQESVGIARVSVPHLDVPVIGTPPTPVESTVPLEYRGEGDPLPTSHEELPHISDPLARMRDETGDAPEPRAMV